MVRIERLSKSISEWIKEKVKEANCNGVVIGLSGGIDSSCVAILCKEAFPNSTLGVIMPCFSNHKDLEHAELLAEKFDIDYKIIDLEETFKKLYEKIEGEEFKQNKKDLAIANLKPRLRMSTLYYFANKKNYLVVGTDNKTEAMIGYFTKYGDGGVDILPLSELFKRDVRRLSEYLGVPSEIINKKPSAGLWDGQTDEGEIGLSYDELDRILEKIDNNESLADEDKNKVEKIKKLIKNSEHKRKMPPSFKL